MHPPARAEAPLVSSGDRDGIPLVDLLDRLLEKGVAASGDLVLSVAGVDLVWLSLRAVLKGIDGREAGVPASASREARVSGSAISATPRSTERVRPVARPLRSRAGADRREGEPASRLGIDQEDVDRGLVQLVLTVVELLRELMERQALRRAEGPGLSDGEVEQLGLALMRLDERMGDLKAHFGLSDADVHPRLRAVAEVS
jgi:hypothetical protein